MKIIVCASYLHAWNSVRPEAEIIIGLAKRGHSITVMAEGASEYVPRLKEYGIKFIDCYPKSKICLNTIMSIRKELKEGDYDICYSLNSKTIPNAAFACIGFKVKLVSYRGTTGGIYRHDPSAYLTTLHPRVDAIICVSKAVEDDIKKRVWKNKSNVVTIYKGHQVEWYSGVKAASREELDIPQNAVVALCAARVRPSKGIPVLLNATKFVNDQNFHLILAGEGYEQFSDLIIQSGMKERVHVLGHRLDVPNLMAMSDFQVQPSISGEGLPRSIVEAMGSAKPTVATTTGGSAEVVADGETGFIVAVNDSEAFGKAMQKLIQNKEKCKEMGKAAQRRLYENFNSELAVDGYEVFFQKLIKTNNNQKK